MRSRVTRASLFVCLLSCAASAQEFRATISGKVTDGSGHGWPLYAKITIDGVPGGAIYTSPYTGHYSVNLPQQHSYTLHVAPVYPGYNTRSLTVHIGTADRVLSAKAFVDSSTAPRTARRALRPASPVPGVTTLTDGQGRFILRGLSPGAYRVHAAYLPDDGWVAEPPPAGHEDDNRLVVTAGG